VDKSLAILYKLTYYRTRGFFLSSSSPAYNHAAAGGELMTLKNPNITSQDFINDADISLTTGYTRSFSSES